MMWIWIVLGVALLLDSLKLRGRAMALKKLPEQVAGNGDHAALCVEGAVLPKSVEGAAQSYAADEGLDVLDIVPARLSTVRSLALLQAADPATYRSQRLVSGRTSGHAMLVARNVCERASVSLENQHDPVEFFRLAARLKQYASRTTDFVVSSDLEPVADVPDTRWAILRASAPGAAVFVAVLQLILLSLLIAGVAWPAVWPWGLAAVGAYHLQPAIAFAGSPLRPHDLLWTVLFRLPMDTWYWVQTIAGRNARKEDPDPIAVRRPIYDKLLAAGHEGFFEPRRDSCPICSSENLKVHIRTGEWVQHKPGRFVLEKCRDCNHIFQNPRLSIPGLDFYYRDFYDGLGAESAEFMFAFTDESYLGRVGMVASRYQPKKWLDVGAGHGHFCCVARDVLPETTFDGLDMSESIEEADRRRWVDRAYRGLFPEIADDIVGQYDAVSMHHYLEHTLDPRSEIAAAAKTLENDGVLLIELPDPECLFGKLLGRYWFPWFQPQHLHFLSIGNLERLLVDAGFEIKATERGPSHQAVEFAAAWFLLFNRLAPRKAPWLPVPSLPVRVLRSVIWSVAIPFIGIGSMFDNLLSPIIKRVGLSNTYRVLAQKRPTSVVARKEPPPNQPTA